MPPPTFRADSGVRADGGNNPNDAGNGDAGTTGQTVLVALVYDGDTARLSAGASVMTPDSRPLSGESVRFLGVDAPEIAHPPAPADCWGDEAHARARDMLQGRTVTLEYDLDPGCTPPISNSQAEACGLRDDFGRLLAYVHLSDGTVANETLIAEGHARSFRRFTHKYTARYNALEEQARNANLGLWTCP